MKIIKVLPSQSLFSTNNSQEYNRTLLFWALRSHTPDGNRRYYGQSSDRWSKLPQVGHLLSPNNEVGVAHQVLYVSRNKRAQEWLQSKGWEQKQREKCEIKKLEKPKELKGGLVDITRWNKTRLLSWSCFIDSSDLSAVSFPRPWKEWW